MSMLSGIEITGPSHSDDPELDGAVAAFRRADPTGQRIGKVFRETFDQLYDGQRTGRYRWDQLFKTEKTHYGTLIEINLRREFGDILSDGLVLDYRINGVEIDCKYSFRFGGWMIPPEAVGHLLLVASANDADSEWALGVVRADAASLRPGSNRDGKKTLSREALGSISWIGFGEPLPPNVLLQVSPEVERLIFSHRSGQKRVNELFRRVQNRRIGRNTIATVAQQDDYMKRVRANGGARTALAAEGIIVAGGDYEAHRLVVERLGGIVPGAGEFVSLTVVPATESDPYSVRLADGMWRVALEADEVRAPAPRLPDIRA